MSKNAIFSVWIQRIAILPCNLKLYTQLANILLDCSSKFDIGETNEFHWSDGQMVSDNFRAQRLVRCSTIYNQFKTINTAATEGLNQGQVQGSTWTQEMTRDFKQILRSIKSSFKNGVKNQRLEKIKVKCSKFQSLQTLDLGLRLKLDNNQSSFSGLTVLGSRHRLFVTSSGRKTGKSGLWTVECGPGRVETPFIISYDDRDHRLQPIREVTGSLGIMVKEEIEIAFH